MKHEGEQGTSDVFAAFPVPIRGNSIYIKI
jgi:hypothetical protein